MILTAKLYLLWGRERRERRERVAKTFFLPSTLGEQAVPVRSFLLSRTPGLGNP